MVTRIIGIVSLVLIGLVAQAQSDEPLPVKKEVDGKKQQKEVKTVPTAEKGAKPVRIKSGARPSSVPKSAQPQPARGNKPPVIKKPPGTGKPSGKN